MKNGKPYAFKVVTYFGIRVIRKLVKKLLIKGLISMLYVRPADSEYAAICDMFYLNPRKEGFIPFPKRAYDCGMKAIFGGVFLVIRIGCAPRVHLELFELILIFGFIHDAEYGVSSFEHFGDDKAHVAVLMG